MGEKHVGYMITQTAGTAERMSEVMYSIFQFVSSSGQDAIRFAHGSTSESVSSSIGFGGSPTVTSFASGSFIVLEPANALPSGYRWQAKFEVAGGSSLNVILSTAGGWDAATKSFIANSALNPPGIVPPVTDAVPWLTANPGTSTQILISSSDLDTYASGAQTVKAPYIRLTDWVPSNAEGSQFTSAMYIGGYIPANPTKNTNPVVIISKTPSIGWPTAYQWGVGFATPASTNSYSKVAPDYDFGVKDLSNCYATVGAFTAGNQNSSAGSTPYAKDIDGAWPPLPIFVYSHTGGTCLGYFGKYSQVSGWTNRSDGDTDPYKEYIVVGNMLFRWKQAV